MFVVFVPCFRPVRVSFAQFFGSSVLCCCVKVSIGRRSPLETLEQVFVLRVVLYIVYNTIYWACDTF